MTDLGPPGREIEGTLDTLSGADSIRLEAPRFWAPTFAIFFGPLALSILVMGAIFAVIAFRNEVGIPRGAWIVFGKQVGITVAVAAIWALVRPRRVPPIEIREGALWLPRFRISRRPTRVPLPEVYSILVLGRGWWRRVIVGAERRLPITVPCSAFASREGPQRLHELLRSAIGGLPDGGERWAGIEHRAEVSRRLREGIAWVTAGLLVLLGLAYGVEITWRVTDYPERLLWLGASNRELILRGEWFRLVTGNLLHVAPWHLVGNAIGLLVFGLFVERILGHACFALVVVASGVAGAAAATLLAGHPLGVGASAIVCGTFSCVVWLNWRYRDDLPSPHRIPAWYWVVIAAAVVIEEASIPNVAHAAHLGGALAGLGIVAWSSRGRSLLSLRTRSLPYRIAASASVLLFLLGAAAGGRAAFTWSDERTLWISRSLLQRGDLDPYLANVLSWHIVRIADAPLGDLELAHGAMSRAMSVVPSDPELLDTQAALAWRLGRLDRALELERASIHSTTDQFRASRLARYELAWLEREGVPLREGDGSGVRAAVRLSAVREGEPGRRAILVELAGPRAGALEIHAIALRGSELIGHMQLFLGPEVGDGLRLVREDSPRNEYGPDVRFEVVLIDANEDRFRGDHYWWNLWSMDPEALALP